MDGTTLAVLVSATFVALVVVIVQWRRVRSNRLRRRPRQSGMRGREDQDSSTVGK